MDFKDQMLKLGFQEWEISKIKNLRKENDFQIGKGTSDQTETIISTGSETIDAILKGGIHAGGITEVVGVSGCGKTQLCLQLSLSLHVSQPHKGTLYICTESVFPTARLAQLCQLSPLSRPKSSDHIFITHCYEFAVLKKTLETQRGFIENKVGMIVIDSIAGIFRNTYAEEEYIQRAHDMRFLARYLHDLSVKHNVIIVCTNQVTSAMTCNDKTVPALGLSWSNLITNRIVLTKSLFNQHSLSVEFSPYVQSGVSVEFDIFAEGVG